MSICLNYVYFSSFLLLLLWHSLSQDVNAALETLAFGGDHPGKVVFQSHLIVEALTDLARVEDPFTSKSEEAQKILKMVTESGLKEIDAGLLHLINGIVLFKSNIKQAQKALLKVKIKFHPTST